MFMVAKEMRKKRTHLTNSYKTYNTHYWQVERAHLVVQLAQFFYMCVCVCVCVCVRERERERERETNLS